jgi:methylenetetrahydrofolate dehydrogenase (NADP+)/methenyltetrahydrofolate cyclohydrolase
MAKILDGKAIAAQIRSEIKLTLDERKTRVMAGERVFSSDSPPPCLAVVLCSDDPASQIYVEKKREACREVGINSFVVKPFNGTGVANWMDPQNHLLSMIEWLNQDASVQGILVQLPLPKPLDQHEVFDHIDPLKDVDVFTPENVGLLLQGRPRFIPCTPAGIQELLTRSGVAIEGKRVCIINRSDVVGKPLSALLCQNNEQANATVTLCHDYTPPERLREACLASDIIVVAVGKPKFLTADMVPEGAVVVDVGITRVEGSKKIVGDVDFEPVAAKASAISPVPGGVGPMTVTMLLRNTMIAQQNALSNRHRKS